MCILTEFMVYYPYLRAMLDAFADQCPCNHRSLMTIKVSVPVPSDGVTVSSGDSG